jgi:hypothetical protein
MKRFFKLLSITTQNLWYSCVNINTTAGIHTVGGILPPAWGEIYPHQLGFFGNLFLLVLKMLSRIKHFRVLKTHQGVISFY